jgi:hypothetical protein
MRVGYEPSARAPLLMSKKGDKFPAKTRSNTSRNRNGAVETGQSLSRPRSHDRGQRGLFLREEYRDRGPAQRARRKARPLPDPGRSFGGRKILGRARGRAVRIEIDAMARHRAHGSEQLASRPDQQPRLAFRSLCVPAKPRSRHWPPPSSSSGSSMRATSSGIDDRTHAISSRSSELMQTRHRCPLPKSLPRDWTGIG